jgi:hypothetical protein
MVGSRLQSKDRMCTLAATNGVLLTAMNPQQYYVFMVTLP